MNPTRRLAASFRTSSSVASGNLRISPCSSTAFECFHGNAVAVETVRLARLLFVCLVLCLCSTGGDDWCSLDSGYTTITDGHGYPHSVYVSVTRDGSIWLRAGRDHASLDWTYEDERRMRTQSVILEQNIVQLMESINYTDYCVMTDVEMSMTVDSGWHPSHLGIYDPATKHSKIIVFKHNRDCYMNTNLTLTKDKQGIVCDGGRRNACKKRNLPDTAHAAVQTVFLKTVNFDPKGEDHWQCHEEEELNSYTFKGSYYHVYVKLASCDVPKDTRVWGHEAKLRPNGDLTTNTVLIPDPMQTAINSGIIRGWHVFVKIVSLQHLVYLQVWRPSIVDELTYTLVGQTLFRPTELRFQEVSLKANLAIRFQRGDVLGLYFPLYNPIAWSSVPCSSPRQSHAVAFFYNASGDLLSTGDSVKFTSQPMTEGACRHYSFTAMLGDTSGSKVIEDWICPVTRSSPSSSSSSSSLSSRSRFSVSQSQDSANPAARKIATSLLDRSHPGSLQHSEISGYVVLCTVACLSLLLLVIGTVSYCRASRN